MQIVSFGKYKGRSVKQLVRDTEYVKWLLKQQWFRQHKIYDTVVSEINRRHNATIGVPKVYFIVNEQLTRLKVGTSIHPKKRLRQIQTGSADTLVLYGAVLGDRESEVQIHAEFYRFRVSGEWFEFPPCKKRVDELLGKERDIQPSKTYSMWEFRLITGLTEANVRSAERLAAKEGIVKFGDFACGFGEWDCLRTAGNEVRGWVWCKMVESGCLHRHRRSLSGTQRSVG